VAVTDLTSLGWDEQWQGTRAALTADGPVARVARVDRGWVTAFDGSAALRLSLDPGTEVAVGDWVVVDPESERVAEVLPRRSSLARRSADGAARPQVLAANVDTIFLVHSLSQPPKARRLERELVLAFESGASPVVILNKSDLSADPAEAVVAMEEIALAVPVHAISARVGDGMEKLHAYTAGHHTVALLGPSGAGKSTLVNALAGDEVQRTGAVRSFDQKGRHTTTAAELVALPDGGLLLDTPGLRAVALWTEEGGDGGGLARAFDDITALAEGCWFADCRHDAEPDCAVREAVEAGRLDPKRLLAWQHLTAELDRLAVERAEAGRTARRGRPSRALSPAAEAAAEGTPDDDEE
jgi:ribosome biogenesis GTPase